MIRTLLLSAASIVALWSPLMAQDNELVVPAQKAGPIEFSVGAFTFGRPETWTWIVPSSAMRKAQLSVPGKDGGASAEITFFHFGPGQGGGVQANVDRWVGQFSDVKSSSKAVQIAQTKVTFVEATGTFSSGMPGSPTTPMAGYAMRGAILESSEGDVYVKMTGPQAVVTEAAPIFDKMVRTAAEK